MGMGAESVPRRLGAVLSSPYDREIASVALPALVGLMMEPLVNAFNAGLVGHLGTHQLSAVSLGSIALNSVTFLFSFLLFLTVPEIAAAAARKDEEQVSRVASQSLWVALGCGLLCAALVSSNAAGIVAALNPPEPMVAALATDYIRIRSLSTPAVLLSFVSIGVFRGFKDTRTPLLGTAASVGVSFVAHVVLLNVLHMGVSGAATASAAASFASCSVLLALLVARGRVRVAHLLQPPAPGVVLPILQRGAVLGMRNMVSFGMILFASTLSARMGSAFQASFEVIRQLWMLTMPFFECLNVATQSLCATSLGKKDRESARAYLLRLLLLAGTVGTAAGAAVWLLHGPLVGFFTRDPLVVANVMMALPLVCACIPLDAAGAILDGSLLAANQSNFMSAVQIGGSVVQYGALLYLAGTGNVTVLGVWATIKVMSLTRLVGGLWRNFASDKSAYLVAPASQAPLAAAPAAPPAVAAVVADGAASLVSVAAVAAAVAAAAVPVLLVETEPAVVAAPEAAVRA